MPSETGKRCPACGRRFWLFRRKYLCKVCHVESCYDCLRRGSLFQWLWPKPEEAWGGDCSKCHQSRLAPIEERYGEACERCHEVELFPSTFRGRVPFDYSREKRDLETDWFRDRSDAERQLRTTARFMGFDLVYNVSQDRETGSEPGSGKGTHYYSMFSLRGVAAHRYHPARK
jgi:hypothetical protein